MINEQQQYSGSGIRGDASDLSPCTVSNMSSFPGLNRRMSNKLVNPKEFTELRLCKTVDLDILEMVKMCKQSPDLNKY